MRATVPTGITLEYDTFGSPDDPALLLVMGFTAQMIQWDERFCGLLADSGLFVIRFDNRDCGLSSGLDGVEVDTGAVMAAGFSGGEMPPVPYTLSDMALDAIGQELGKNLDPFDLICHVAFDKKPLTRRERAENVKKRDVFTKYGPQARAVLDALLEKYRDEGVLNLDDTNVLRIAPFSGMGSVVQLIKAFGGKEGFEQAVHELQNAIYSESA
jgi:hypothetical protein